MGRDPKQGPKLPVALPLRQLGAAQANPSIGPLDDNLVPYKHTLVQV